MKKFYEAPVVELNAFSVEDVITTSVVDPAEFQSELATAYNVAVADVKVINYNGGNYTW